MPRRIPQVKKPIRYVRVSLLSACNFNCLYCRPGGSFSNVYQARTPVETVKTAIASLHELGIRKIRFTGGEPLLYPHLTELVAFSRTLSPDVHVALTTNGSLLTERAPDLGRAGLDSINISLDTRDPGTCRRITGRNNVTSVLAGLVCAQEHIPVVKLNTVVLRGVNDGEAADLVHFADERGVDIRFIEYMPSRNAESRDRYFCSGAALRHHLPFDLFPLAEKSPGAARYYGCKRLGIRVGFIEPVSRPFCATCDRIRLTATGDLYCCLFSEQSFNLFAALSRGEKDIRIMVDRLIEAQTIRGFVDSARQEEYLPQFAVTGG